MSAPRKRYGPLIARASLAMLFAATIITAGCTLLNSQSSNTANNTRSANSQSAPSPDANTNQSQATSGGRAQSIWELNARELGNEDGKTFTFDCSANGSAHNVWGSDVYTADSSICTAAVHAGLASLERGGSVTIELRPGRQIYGASERNGVTSMVYGPYDRSFAFKSANAGGKSADNDDVVPILWNTSTAMIPANISKPYKFKCPADGKPGNVWGTSLYTADSSICTAAVHAGIIKADQGGLVTVELRDGEDTYKGSSHNGVTSNDYGKYGRSFAVK